MKIFVFILVMSSARLLAGIPVIELSDVTCSELQLELEKYGSIMVTNNSVKNSKGYTIFESVNCSDSIGGIFKTEDKAKCRVGLYCKEILVPMTSLAPFPRGSNRQRERDSHGGGNWGSNRRRSHWGSNRQRDKSDYDSRQGGDYSPDTSGPGTRYNSPSPGERGPRYNPPRPGERGSRYCPSC